MRLSEVPCLIVSTVPSPLKGDTVWLTPPLSTLPAGAVCFELSPELDSDTTCGEDSLAVATLTGIAAGTAPVEAADFPMLEAILAGVCWGEFRCEVDGTPVDNVLS